MLRRFKLGLAAVAVLLVGTAGAEVYQIDSEHSNAVFSIRHLVSRTSGQFNEFSGAIHYDAKQPEMTQVEATIQVASIDTDNAKRDGHLKSGDFFYVEQFPTISIKSTKAVVKDGVLQVTGEFTLHGVTKTITLPIEVLGTGTHPYNQKPIAGFEARMVLARSDYGVNSWTDAAGVLGDEVKISLNVEAIAGE